MAGTAPVNINELDKTIRHNPLIFKVYYKDICNHNDLLLYRYENPKSPITKDWEFVGWRLWDYDMRLGLYSVIEAEVDKHCIRLKMKDKKTNMDLAEKMYGYNKDNKYMVVCGHFREVE